jgi:hypothetical protein
MDSLGASPIGVASIAGAAPPRLLSRQQLVNGRLATVECLELAGRTLRVERGAFTTVRLEDEWFEDVEDPASLLAALEEAPVKADLFTFWQRLPHTAPRHPYPMERERLAALPVTSYDQWWTQRIKSRVRSQVRKARGEGVEVREVPFDDDFVHGMTRIFNESPVRQNRPFWHYGKDFDTVKAQFSRYLFRESMVAAYYRGSMIGFMMLADAGPFALTGQVLSSLAHRDKSPNFLLVDRAVALCAARGHGHLVYFHWTDDSLGEFKRRCGFEPVDVPRYHVPLTSKGRLALRLGLHKGWKAALPPRLKQPLKRVRSAWYGLRWPEATRRAADERGRG